MVFLILAIIFEVLGTSFLKIENQILGYFFMSKAIKTIQIGLAYAVWELLGIIFILLTSFIIFQEHINLIQTIGIFLSIIGIIMINSGEIKK